MTTSIATRFRRLDSLKVQETLDRLERRIAERFPDSSLRAVARELADLSAASTERLKAIRRPHLLMRLAVVLCWIAVLGALAALPFLIHSWGELTTLAEAIQVIEPALGALFFISAFLVFLLSIELRMKRRRILTALHELRAIAHVVDMHQLTKDPSTLLAGTNRTASSPERGMSEFELSRYFDYCTELLALISKVSALYIQDFPDPVAVSAVDEVENLTTGLARKIWQKIMILGQNAER